jgi:hypothetical protein
MMTDAFIGALLGAVVFMSGYAMGYLQSFKDQSKRKGEE